MTTQLAKFLDHNAFEPWDLMFRDLFERDSFFLPAINSKSNYPTDIYEDEKSVTIEVAASGLDKEDINIEEENGVITVSYQKDDEQKSDEGNYRRRGITRKSFNLSWRFSDKFDLKNTEAELDKGILKISIPKLEEKEMSIKNIIKIK
jgi:HSP20 family protein